jgi:hypothetical protein
MTVLLKDRFVRIGALRSFVNLNLLGAILLAFSLFMTGQSSAQVLYGSIVGTVTDQSGALLPHATITVTQTETGEVRTAPTNDRGDYTISTIPAGTYKVVVSKAGFKQFSTTNIAVAINTTVRVDAGLSVGNQTETINVTTSDIAQLQTDTVDVHGQISTQELTDLPQPTTTYEGLIGELPGASPPSASSGGTNNPVRSMSISMNGTSNEGTNVTIDGVSATNAWVQFNSTAVPSSEAIETVNVVSATPGADQGAANGASIRVQIKSGTNSFHGSAYEYNENNAMEAKPYFNPAGKTNPKFIDNDFGATIGGPIVKNKMFFFASYEGEWTRQAGSGFYSLPTPNMTQGILASTTPIFDPATGNADGSGRRLFPKDSSGRYIIPTSRFNSISQKLLPFVPSGVPEGVFANNLFINTPSLYDLQKIDSKVDWNASPKFRIVGRVSDYPYKQFSQPPLGQVLQDGGTDAYGNIYAFSGSVTYVASPKLVFDATFGSTHTVQNLYPPQSGVRYGSDVLGIPNTNLGPLPTAGGVPQFAISGLSTWGYGYPALIYADPVFEYIGNGTMIRGNHSIRFGVDVSQQHMNHKEVNPTTFSFSGGLTSLYCPSGTTDPNCAKGSPSTSVFNSFADFLLGTPQTEANNQLTTDWATLRTWQFSPYVSDTWQVSRKMTVYAGVAWNFFPIPYRENHEMEYLDPSTGIYEVCGLGNVSTNCGVTIQKDLFAPRIGATYRIQKNTVVRGGYALAPEQVNMERDGLYNYPINLTQSVSGSNSYTSPGTLNQGFPSLAVPNIGSGIVPLPGTVTVSTPPKNFIRGYTESENLSIQRELGWNTLAQVGYVGTLTVHMHARENLNYGLPGGGQASQQMYHLTTSATGGGFTAQEINILPLNHTKYQSMQALIQKSFSSGLQFQANYTWSHENGVCCSENSDGAPFVPIPQYFYLNHANMPNDRPNHFEMSQIYVLPFGKNKQFLTKGPLSAIVGGWEVNTVLSRYSGTPFTVTAPSTSLNAPGSSQIANRVKSSVAIYGYRGRTLPYFDTTAFAPVTTATFGNAGLNTVRGPGFFNMDANIMRTFNIWENLRLQFRFQALNALNHPNFSNPDSGATDSNFGLISGINNGDRLIGQRYLKVGAKLMF